MNSQPRVEATAVYSVCLYVATDHLSALLKLLLIRDTFSSLNNVLASLKKEEYFSWICLPHSVDLNNFYHIL